MSQIDISRDVMREFAEIVHKHKDEHRSDQIGNVVVLLIIGCAAYVFTHMPIIYVPVWLVLGFRACKVMFQKPSLNEGVSSQEISELSVAGAAAIGRLRNKTGRGVLIGDLAALVRSTSEKKQTAERNRRRAEAERRLRHEQDGALYVRRDDRPDGWQ